VGGMEIEQITLAEFYRLRPSHEGDVFKGSEKAIYATPNRQVIAVVFEKPTWSSTFVAFRRVDGGQYQCTCTGTGLHDLNAAKRMIESLSTPEELETHH
jgi:hypothetical protein